jgi:hypothetical protein
LVLGENLDFCELREKQRERLDLLPAKPLADVLGAEVVEIGVETAARSSARGGLQ